jgi:magnesium-protoporphyrin IX monomethyl ester (oxidative) cyclase
VLRLALVNPPFALINMPSLAMTQLSGLLRSGPRRDRLTVSEHYVNMDVARRLGAGLYSFIANSYEALNGGLGEWMFRKTAFPELEDNAEEYFERFHSSLPRAAGDVATMWRTLLDRRDLLGACIDDVIAEHRLAHADVVGFTTMFSQTCASIAIARAIKAKNPSAIVVMGGANCEAPMGAPLARHVPAIDYVFSGPALVSLPEFIDCLIDGRVDACDAIDGVMPGSHRRARGRPSATGADTVAACSPPRAIGKELDIDCDIALDYTTYLEAFDASFPGDELSPMLFLETSRGCWWGEKAHCTFCGLNGTTMNFRAMRPSRCLELFGELFQHAPRVRRVQAVDNILPRNYLTDVLPFLETPETMQIFYEVKADLSADDLRVLARARVLRIQPGIESLATSTLQLMKKGTTAHQNIAFLKNCAINGITPAWNFLIGFPGEDEAVYAKYLHDLPQLVHLPPPEGIYPVRFDRYSPYFTRAEQYGLRLTPLDFYAFVYPFPSDSLRELAYYFADRTEDPPYAAAVARWIDRLRDRVETWRDAWNAARQARRPVLEFDDAEPTVIVDSRGGAVVRHDVGALGRAVLLCLTKGRRVHDVTAMLPHADPADVEAILHRASALGLLFEEQGRFLSLVIADEAEAQHVWPANERRRDRPIMLAEWR